MSYAPTCPTCGAAIATQSIVEAFNVPPAWQFWGQPGERWKKCEGEQGQYHYVHFVVVVNDVRQDRMAWYRVAGVGLTQGKLV